MELTVLGKYGPYPKAGGACSGYLVKSGRDTVLLDCGCGVLSRLLSHIDLGELTAVFISHLHFDHTSDLLPLRYLLEDLHHTVTVYTAYEDSEWYRVLFTHPNLNIVNIDENSVVNLGDLRLHFVKMNHTGGDYGIVIKGDKTICYTGDTARCEAVERCCRECDYLLADCSKPSGFQASHMTVDDARELAQKYGCQILATHQSSSYNPQKDLADSDLVFSVKEGKTYKL